MSEAKVEIAREVRSTVLTAMRGARALTERVWQKYRVPLTAYGLSRLMVLACTFFAVRLREAPFGVLEALGSSDGAWFIGIAVYGYPEQVPDVLGVVGYSGFPFFPLLPLLIRVFGLVTGLPALAAGVLLNNLLGLASAILIWEIARRLVSDSAANTAARLYCFFPGSIALSMVYSEALFIVLVMTFVLCLMNQRWVGAGLAAALAGATRQQGIVLGVVLLVAALRHMRHDGHWRALGAAALAPLGTVSYFLYLWWHTGDVAIWLQARQAWGTSPGLGLLAPVRMTQGDAHGQMMAPLALAGLVWVVVSVVIAVRRPVLNVVLAVYTAIILLTIFGLTEFGAQPRYLLTAFPLLIPIAAVLRERGANYLTAAFSIGLALTTTMYTSGLGALP